MLLQCYLLPVSFELFALVALFSRCHCLHCLRPNAVDWFDMFFFFVSLKFCSLLLFLKDTEKRRPCGNITLPDGKLISFDFIDFTSFIGLVESLSLIQLKPSLLFLLDVTFQILIWFDVVHFTSLVGLVESLSLIQLKPSLEFLLDVTFETVIQWFDDSNWNLKSFVTIQLNWIS